MTTPVERLLAKLPDATKAGKGWSARCPAHEDRRASLSIGEGDDGRALIRCHAGCRVDAVCAAWAAKTPRSVLLGELTEDYALSYDDARLVLDRVEGGMFRAGTASPTNEPSAERDPVAHFSYRRARGDRPRPAAQRC